MASADVDVLFQKAEWVTDQIKTSGDKDFVPGAPLLPRGARDPRRSSARTVDAPTSLTRATGWRHAEKWRNRYPETMNASMQTTIVNAVSSAAGVAGGVPSAPTAAPRRADYRHPSRGTRLPQLKFYGYRKVALEGLLDVAKTAQPWWTDPKVLDMLPRRGFSAGEACAVSSVGTRARRNALSVQGDPLPCLSGGR